MAGLDQRSVRLRVNHSLRRFAYFLSRSLMLAGVLSVTAAVWAGCVAWCAHVEAGEARLSGQDESGRPCDVLTLARIGIRRAGHHDQRPGEDQTLRRESGQRSPW